jgi:hypothetical protein
VTRKVFLAMLADAGFTDARCVGTGEYRTSGQAQATFYTASRPVKPANVLDSQPG